MLLQDDTVAEALHAVAEEARRPLATRYETAHGLQRLLRTEDPVAQTVTAAHSQLTADAARAALGATTMQNPEADGSTEHGRGSTPEPSAEFRQAAQRFTGTWRPLVRAGRCGRAWNWVPTSCR